MMASSERLGVAEVLNIEIGLLIGAWIGEILDTSDEDTYLLVSLFAECMKLFDVEPRERNEEAKELLANKIKNILREQIQKVISQYFFHSSDLFGNIFGSTDLKFIFFFYFSLESLSDWRFCLLFHTQPFFFSTPNEKCSAGRRSNKRTVLDRQVQNYF